MKSDLDIAREAKLVPIQDIAWKMGFDAEEIVQYGGEIAKIKWSALKKRVDGPKGFLVLVTSVNPTPFGEGKTVTTIGLTQALNRIGKNACCVIREPSMGPVFGIKGGAAGGDTHKFYQWKKSTYTLQEIYMQLPLHIIYSHH